LERQRAHRNPSESLCANVCVTKNFRRILRRDENHCKPKYSKNIIPAMIYDENYGANKTLKFRNKINKLLSRLNFIFL